MIRRHRHNRPVRQSEGLQRVQDAAHVPVKITGDPIVATVLAAGVGGVGVVHVGAQGQAVRVIGELVITARREGSPLSGWMGRPDGQKKAELAIAVVGDKVDTRSV